MPLPLLTLLSRCLYLLIGLLGKWKTSVVPDPRVAGEPTTPRMCKFTCLKELGEVEGAVMEPLPPSRMRT